MNINIIKKFWFQAAALLVFVFILSVWALNPVSNDSLKEVQSQNLSQLSTVYKGLVNEKINKINSEINFFISELENSNKESIDNLNTPVRAIIELENKGEQLSLTGNELRSVDLTYWNVEDISKEINRIFYLDNNFIYDEYLKIEAPNGESLFGVLKAMNGKFYFSVLNLHFSSVWASQFNIEQARVILTNTLGEVVYHPEVQYIGSVYSDFEDFEYGSITSHIKETRGELTSLKSLPANNLVLFVSADKWLKPFNYSFYLKFMLCLMAILLLFNLMYTNFKKLEVKSLKFNNSDLAIGSSDKLKAEAMNSQLKKKIKKLENLIASQKEHVSNDSFNKNLYEIKTKVAHLIGQVQLVIANPEDKNQIETVDLKIREIYKKVYQLVENSDNEESEKFDALASAPEATSKKQISYSIEEEYNFNDTSDRIEITEDDLGEENFDLLTKLPQDKKNFDENTDIVDEKSIEDSIAQQLETQNFNKKAFSIEDNFLEEQKRKIIKFDDENNFGDQLKQVDELLKTADSKFSETRVEDIIRKPRINL